MEQKESMKNFAKKKVDAAEANATKMIKKAVAERTEQIMVESDSESLHNYCLWQEHKEKVSSKDDPRDIHLSSAEKWSKLPSPLRRVLQRWNKLLPKEKDGESGRPLLDKIKAAVAAKTLDEYLPWLEAATSNKQDFKIDKQKEPVKRKGWLGKNAQDNSKRSKKAKK